MKDGDMGAGKLQYTTYRKAPNTHRTRYKTGPHQKPVNRPNTGRFLSAADPKRVGWAPKRYNTRYKTARKSGPRKPTRNGSVSVKHRPETGRFRKINFEHRNRYKTAPCRETKWAGRFRKWPEGLFRIYYYLRGRRRNPQRGPS